jgi:YfiH family protein
MSEYWIVPDWPAPTRVRCLLTTRHGGVSQGAYASLNLGNHVGDDAQAVAENRARLVAKLPVAPKWLQQVHGTTVLDASVLTAALPAPEADALLARQAGEVCAVLTADCLPVLLCDKAGTVVAAVHAGWRGLQAGVLERAIAAMACPGDQLLAYLGPAIGPEAFEVGDDVRDAFITGNRDAAAAFKVLSSKGNTPCAARPMENKSASEKWLANIYLLARQGLARLGVDAVYGGDYCTVREAERFFSYRRDGITGRMAALIWLAEDKSSGE